MPDHSAAAIASPHPLATDAGAAVLAEGGNAIEAAIATAAVLCVVGPHMSGPGGDALALIGEADGSAHALMGIGQCAAGVPAGSAAPARGPAAARTAAGFIDACGRAFAHSRAHWDGGMDWASLLAPAIGHAKAGFAVGASLHWWHTQQRAVLCAQPGFADVFEPAGRAPEAGERLQLPALAQTLERIATHGAREFYDGALAREVAAELQAVGAPLAAGDLAACAARWETPLAMPYQGGELLTLPPPSQGVTTLEILALARAAGLNDTGAESADRYHLLIEAAKRALADRDRHLAEVRDGIFDPARLLDAVRVSDRARHIDRVRAAPLAQRYSDGDTAWLGVRDAQGRWVSWLQSVFMPYGSGVVLPGSGVVWHNRGAGFSSDPRHPNAAAPGRRPMHTLNPFLYREGGRIRLAVGTQGGDGQPQTLSCLLPRLIEERLSPDAALAQPRFFIGAQGEEAIALHLEEHAGTSVIGALQGRGHIVKTLPAMHPLMGQAGVVSLLDGRPQACHDPRGDGTAAVVHGRA
jgi:gamma-glutamyltranspeptidase/glutathione hydrolase